MFCVSLIVCRLNISRTTIVGWPLLRLRAQPQTTTVPFFPNPYCRSFFLVGSLCSVNVFSFCVWPTCHAFCCPRPYVPIFRPHHFFLQSLYDSTTKRKLLDKDPVQTQWENKRFYLYDIPLDALFISLTFYAEEKKTITIISAHWLIWFGYMNCASLYPIDTIKIRLHVSWLYISMQGPSVYLAMEPSFCK
jgi:hypothetical protein